MTGVVIFTHANLGESLIQAVELIIGPLQQTRTVGLHHGDGVDDFEEKCHKAAHDVDSGDGVLLFVDFLGGTPSNTALKCAVKEKYPCIAGVNMPMLLEVLTRRGELCLGELAELAVNIGLQGVRLLDISIEDKPSIQETDGVF